MSITLSNGYQIPEDGDSGWWDLLIANWTRMNGHTHDGVDSNKIPASNIEKGFSNIEAADWSADQGGSTFEALVTMPDGYTFDNSIITVIDLDNGYQIFPTIGRVTENSLSIIVNDNTLNLKVLYA